MSDTGHASQWFELLHRVGNPPHHRPKLPLGDGTITRGAGILEGVQAHQDRATHGGPLPMAWFAGSLTIVWYCVKGHEGSHVERERPWYEDRVMPTFTDMLGALRLPMWEFKVYGESGEVLPSPECIRKRLHKLSALA